jgi:ribosomal protein S18 acetylase RimI-like enzyme
VKVCQAFAREEERESFAPLQRAGFQSLTQLVELRRELGVEATGTSRMEFERVDGENRVAFTAALLASFEGSLDCPEVSGSRTEDELLATYTDSPGTQDLWFLARLEGESAGVLLLESNVQPGVCELTYVGIAPIFRRCGLGAELVRFALHSARIAGHSSILLSVDERNFPARRLYEALGFQASGARFVFLADWPDVS